LYQHCYEIPPYNDAPIITTRVGVLVIGMWYVMGKYIGGRSLSIPNLTEDCGSSRVVIKLKDYDPNVKSDNNNEFASLKSDDC
jgi:hypothetical protein